MRVAHLSWLVLSVCVCPWVIGAAAPTERAVAPVAIDNGRAPGLVGEYFKDVASPKDFKADGVEPFLVRTDKNIDFRSGNGEFFGSKLSDDFVVVWNGYLRVREPGEYTFALLSDDGAVLYLNDKAIVDDHDVEVMKAKEGKVTLARGDYPLRLRFEQKEGGAGCQLRWKKPKDKPDQKPRTIAPEALFHDASQEQVKWDQVAFDKTHWSRREWAKKYGENYDKMDYGPFMSATIELDAKTENFADKGIVVRIDDNTSMCFDTELMRWAGWTGGFLDNHGVVFDGRHGLNPGPDGEVMFLTKPEPAAKEGEKPDAKDGYKDPRKVPYGPLPKEWAHYKGLYLNGEKVVLNYSVGETDVLELAGVTKVGDETVLTRTMRLGPSNKPVTMLVADDMPASDSEAVKPLGVVCSDGIKPTEKSADNGRIYLTFPARTEAKTYKIGVYRGNEVAADKLGASEDLDALVKTAGPKRWGEAVVTKGEMAKSTTQPYVLDTITAPEQNPYHSWLRFGGLDFFSDGRAAITTWSGDVWIVAGIDDKLDHVQWKRYATGLFQPLGLKIVDDVVYVLGRDQITRLHDTNNDGEADFYEDFNNGCEVTSSFHEFSFDLQTDKDGNFYYTKAGPVRPGGRGWQIISDNNGSVLKVSKDGSKFSVYATGLRAPNGMSISPKTGMMTVGDNEGTWVPACPIRIVHEGDVLGVPDLYHNDAASKAYVPPVCWLPHSDVDNSSGGQVWVETGDKWGPFEHRLLHTSYGTCSLFLVSMETVDGTVQGGVVKFPNLDFITGICRPRFNPVDHQLYVVGLRGWQTTAAKDCGFQRVRYTGAPVKMPTEFHIKHDGVEVTFTTPMDPKTAQDVGNYAVEQWNYKWSSDYGSPDLSVAEPKQQGHDSVDVTNATLSADHKTLFIKLEEVVPVMQMKIQMKLKAEDGSPMNFSIYNTINKVPKAEKSAAASAGASAN